MCASASLTGECAVPSILVASLSLTTEYRMQSFFHGHGRNRVTFMKNRGNIRLLRPRKSQAVHAVAKNISSNSALEFLKRQLPFVFSFAVFSIGLGLKLNFSSTVTSLPPFASVSISARTYSVGEKHSRRVHKKRLRPLLGVKDAASQGDVLISRDCRDNTDPRQPENSERDQGKNDEFASASLHPTSSENGITNSFDEPAESQEDEELKKAFEELRSKSYALSVGLKIVALLDSLPQSWIKDFIQAQGRRLKMNAEYKGSLNTIFSSLASPLQNVKSTSKSVMAADVVTLGDSWLELAIRAQIIEPIANVEQQDWFNRLNNRWKAYLCRDSSGQLSPSGEIWGAPYRWGCLAVAYRKDLFKKHKIPSFEDWKDLWQPELQGKISMVDDPREVMGVVLKFLGASYNTQDFELEVPGGKNAVKDCFHVLQRQVLLFDRNYYVKAFEAGDSWVAVGWTSNLIPMAKRISNVAVVVPKSGTSLWADLWCIPATSRIQSNKVGGRVRGPSPLIHQWFDFCLQPSRAVVFEQGICPGASPLSLPEKFFSGAEKDGREDVMSGTVLQISEEKRSGPQFDTNLVSGMPPPDILPKCEFLEPLSTEARRHYECVMAEPTENKVSWISYLWGRLDGSKKNIKG